MINFLVLTQKFFFQKRTSARL